MENPETSTKGLRYRYYKTWLIEKFSHILDVKVSPEFQVEPLSTWHISLTKETNGIGLYLHRHSEERNFEIYYTIEITDAENNILHYRENFVLPSTDDSRFVLLKDFPVERMNKIMHPVGDALTVRMRIDAVRI